jgi:hypothetical protein
MNLSTFAVALLLKQDGWVLSDWKEPSNSMVGYKLDNPDVSERPKAGDLFSFGSLLPDIPDGHIPEPLVFKEGAYIPPEWTECEIRRLVEHVIRERTKRGYKVSSVHFWRKIRQRIYKPSIFAEQLPLP